MKESPSQRNLCSDGLEKETLFWTQSKEIKDLAKFNCG